MQNKANFQKSQVDVTPIIIMDYEEKSNWTLGENKPNSKPNKANLYFTAENTEYAEKKDISVSDCSIEKYALYAISPCSLRTRRLMKNKANSNPKQTQTKPIFVETIGNPRMDVPDIPAIAEIAHKANIPLLTEALTITLSFAKIASSY